MRPDEHKRKKNAQYKKKHGMAVDKPEKESSAEKTTGTAQAQGRGPKKQQQTKTHLDADTKTGWYHIQGNGGAQNTRDGVTFGSNHLDKDQAQDQVEDAKFFRRREVASNWSRYEGIDDPEEEDSGATLRGADFAQLLSVSSSSSAQFRFQDEKDWQEETSTSEVNDLLAIDCDQLSAALECVPLHQRLDIDGSAFQPQHIELFLQDAHKKRESYNAGKDGISSTAVGSVNLFLQDAHKKRESYNAGKDGISSTAVGSVNQSDNGSSTISTHKEETRSIDTDTGSGSKPKESPNMEQDTDFLDEILGASEMSETTNDLSEDSNTVPSKTTEPQIEQTTHKNTSEDFSKEETSVAAPQLKQTNIEDELDTLLSMDDEEDEKEEEKDVRADDDGVEKSTSAKPEKAAAGNTDELESWLDDMLGD